jgi:hypothetical protein
MSETDIGTLSENELHDLVKTMVRLGSLAKTQAADLSKVRKAYKVVSERVKLHMQGSSIKFVDLPDHQIHTYERIRESPMNPAFIAEGLKQFFENTKTKVDPSFADAAAAFLKQRKKDKVGGTSVWTTTMRARKGAGRPGIVVTPEVVGTKRKREAASVSSKSEAELQRVAM